MFVVHFWLARAPVGESVSGSVMLDCVLCSLVSFVWHREFPVVAISVASITTD